MIYLDNAATTKLAPEVFEAMTPYLKDIYGNPGAVLYQHGKASHKAIEFARTKVAEMIGSQPEQIIFTSGGTESNATVLLGLADHLLKENKTHIIVSAVEHESVLSAAERLRSTGFSVSILPVMSDGTVNLADLDAEITDQTGLVSIMYVNNELGSVNPVEQIGDLCKARGVLFHTDCVQAAGTEHIDVKKISCDFLSLSAHKIHGPKGAGAVFARDKAILKPLIPGGHAQEFSLRGGTQNVPAIVGFAAACELVSKNFRHDLIHTSAAKQLFFESLLNTLSPENAGVVRVNGCPVVEPGKILNLTLHGVDAETLIMMLDMKGVCAAMGAACTGDSTKPSHVLTAIGLNHEMARSTLRLSFSKYVSEEDAREAGVLTAVMVNILLANTKVRDI